MLALAVLLGAAVADPPIAAPVASWDIKGAPGAVTMIVGRLKSGGRIVVDRLVADRASLQSERRELSGNPAKPGSCMRASKVRPFTRLRRFAADGRLMWQWRARAREGMQLHAAYDADCLSPDGHWLTTLGYGNPGGDGGPAPVSAGVLAVDRAPAPGVAIGRRTRVAYGTLRETDLTGWLRGAPATLGFSVISDNGASIVADEAIPRRR